MSAATATDRSAAAAPAQPRATAPVRVAGRLLAPPPAWHRDVDVVVVGSGVAGLTVALGVAPVASVLVVTKGALDAGATAWAQGGIAAAVDLADHPEAHVADTLTAGAGLCDAAAVRVLAEEGPQRLAQLMARGAAFDRQPAGWGALALTREGGHGRARIVHAGGDATGWEVQRALVAALAHHDVAVLEHAFVLDVLRSEPDGDGRRAAAGVVVAVPEANGGDAIGWVTARAVVLAAGGSGHVYASSTNPAVATGDGVALALRAGAATADLEFVQFHPTVFWPGPDALGQQLLVSEAVRGEGAVLVDGTGRRVMEGVHPLADLAPRDVVARAMSERMGEAPGGIHDHLFLDATRLGAATLEHRFPTIVTYCRAAGIDPVTDPIPVAPGAHFACGGVRTDRRGRTDISGLSAVGETAATGVHGANRLASNSLLEGLVFGDRVAAQLVLALPPPVAPDPVDAARPPGGLAARARGAVTAAMSRHVGVRRDGAGLAAAARTLAGPHPVPDAPPGRADWEATNIHTVASVIVAAARARTESRGCHWRSDHPQPDERWRQRLVVRLDDDGTFVTSTAPLAERA